MRLRNALTLTMQIVTALLAAVIVVALLRPDLLPDNRTVVEFGSSERSERPGVLSYADAVERAAPAVVNIHSNKQVTEPAHPFFEDPFFRRFFGEQSPFAPRQRTERSLGSGVIVSRDGYILTNYHVVRGGEEIEVTLRDGRTARASVVGTDPETDLAVLRVRLDDLPTIVFGASERIRVGDVVLAIGNPFGVGQTVTSGIISATGRSRLGLTTYENFMQTDAAINPGNSGGALVDSNGELLGINTAIFSRSGGSQGIGFAIPVDLARDVLKQVIEQGRVVRCWFGIKIQEIGPALAESFEVSPDSGVVVATVVRDSPAYRAGMRPGDIITAINGRPTRNAADALDAIAASPPGERFTATLLRQGEWIEVEEIADERPSRS